MRVGPPLAYIELTLLSVLTLWLALQPLSPVPRPWAMASAALLAAQTAAVRGIALEPRTPGVPVDGREALDTLAEVVGIIVVPALTAALLAVVWFHLARANGRTRRRLARARGTDAREPGAARPSAATGPPAAEPPPARGPGAPAAPPA